MKMQTNLQFDKEKTDYRGKFFLKLHYIKINISAFFCTFFNKLVWRLKGVDLGSSTKFYGFSKLYRYPSSKIILGKNCSFRSDKYSNLIGVNRNCIISTHTGNAVLTIGDNCGFSGVSIGCSNSITIGSNVLVGANVVITDFDWHNIDPAKRRNDSGLSKPIIIHDNVFIGLNSVIWKGVTIGKNSVIGANSLVTKNVSENSIYGGNPAKFIKFIDS